MPLIYVKQSDDWIACNGFSILDDQVMFTPEETEADPIELVADDEIRFDSADVALQFYNWLQTVAEQVI